jgi:hypothetical protein
MGSRGSAGSGDRAGSNRFTATTSTAPPRPSLTQEQIAARQRKVYLNSQYTEQARRLIGEDRNGIANLSDRSLSALNSERGKALIEDTLEVERLLRSPRLQARERESLEAALEQRKRALRIIWRG